MYKNLKLEKFKEYIRGRKCAVIGVGISNRPLITWLAGLGAKVTAFDKLGSDDPVMSKTIADFKEAGVDLEYSIGEGYLERLKTDVFDYVFKTPKMRFETPELVAAKDKGAVLTTEMELFMSLCPAKIFGITGSDGKTTTTTLVSEMLKKAGYKVWLGGNIGTPLLDQIGNITPDDMAVLELSSFQLLGMRRSCDVAIVTNITPNHLDFHTDYQEYIDAKTNIFRYQGPTGRLVLNAGCDLTFDMRMISSGKVVMFTADDNAQKRDNVSYYDCYLLEGDKLISSIDGVKTEIMTSGDIFIPGYHNIENYLAAAAAVEGYVSYEDIKAVAKEFPGVPHRIEFVREIDGVKWYNSSIDTSPNRAINTMKALAGRNMKGVLICGGADKKCIYDGLGDAILNVSDRILIYGTNAPFVKDILAKEANGRKYQLIEFEGDDKDVYEFPETHDNVVNTYKDMIDKARALAKPGEIVIMSSIGTSYDHFRHFEHRGDMFRDLVNSL